tara:strand:- start:1711 stop:2001 length:291 start_codon:yes stop_codon:yes gene_type:complete
MNSSEGDSTIEPTIYTPTDISIIIGGVAAAFATIVYSLKHIKKSSCLGFNCEQVVVDDHPDPQLPCDHVEDVEQNNSDILTLTDLLTHNIILNSEV